MTLKKEARVDNTMFMGLSNIFHFNKTAGALIKEISKETQLRQFFKTQPSEL